MPTSPALAGLFLRSTPLLAIVLASALPSRAATITLNVTDALGETSFASDTLSHWSTVGAPTSGNDYVVDVSGRALRTPTTGAGLTFAGDSLTLTNGGQLLFKTNSASDQTYTFNGGGLILDNNGLVQNATNGNRAQTIAGKLTVNSGGGVFLMVNQAINVSAATTLNGTLNLAASTHTTTISGATGFGTSGKITLASSGTTGTSPDLIQTAASTFTFDVGANGTTYISGANATLNTATFNGTFAFTLGAEDLVLGNSWTIVSNSTLAESFAGTFVVTGFTETANVWTSTDGLYQFSEATGVLSVIAIPEPSTYAVIVGALALGSVAWKRRRRSLP